MDLNQLLYHHQVALIDAAKPPAGKPKGIDLIAHYGKRIRFYRQKHGLSQYRAFLRTDY